MRRKGSGLRARSPMCAGRLGGAAERGDAAQGLEGATNNLRTLARYGHAPSITAVRELGLGPL